MSESAPPMAAVADRVSALEMFKKHQTFARIVAEELYDPKQEQDTEDCHQAAMLGLWEACLSYTPNMRPLTHIRWAVRTQITELKRRTGKRKRKRENAYLDSLRRRTLDGERDICFDCIDAGIRIS
jgi:hypothetical protein